MLDLLSAFALPQACEQQQKIAKKHFYDDATFRKAMGARLQEEVESILLVRHLMPDTCRLACVVNELVEYTEILFLQITLKHHVTATTNLTPLLEAIHKTLPYPLVLLVSGEAGQMLSLAEKRINQQDKDSDKLVLQEQHMTPWLSAETPFVSDFMDSLHFAKMTSGNLLAYYQAIIERMVQLNISVKTGQNQFVQAQSMSRDTLKQIEALEQEISRHRQQLNKTIAFNDKVALNMKIKQLNQQLQAVMK
jgi:hypothetical protein